MRWLGHDSALNTPARVGADVIVLVGVAVVFPALIRLSSDLVAPITDVGGPSSFDTSPAMLPYYAARSLLRMFAALVGSTAFLSVTLTMWLVLFPGSQMGLEAAAVFAIFTSRAPAGQSTSVTSTTASGSSAGSS